MIPAYPDFAELSLKLRGELHPLFKNLKDGVSEHCFANIYLFRNTHSYKIASLGNDLYVITGKNKEEFFMLPFGLPEKPVIDKLFEKYAFIKCVPERLANKLSEMGYRSEEDRDNFDYLYKRSDMATLAGRKFYKKKNRVKKFLSEYSPVCLPLTRDRTKDALSILDLWKGEKDFWGDYDAALDALQNMEALSLCGCIYYVNDKPVAYTMGEELGSGNTFVVHFEKGIHEMQGLFQFVARHFASLLPEKYEFINREQDLGLEGLRHAKESLHPAEFVKKYKVFSK